MDREGLQPHVTSTKKLEYDAPRGDGGFARQRSCHLAGRRLAGGSSISLIKGVRT